MSKLRQAIRQVVETHSRDYRGRAEDYEGMNASQVLSELRERKEELGLNLQFTTLLDVHNELISLYGRPNPL